MVSATKESAKPGPGARALEEARIRELLEEVRDPEIPVLTLADLGVLRGVTLSEGGEVEVTITPTYTGCPALDTMADDIRCRLQSSGFRDITIRRVLSPAWTTDWLSAAGRAKLRAYGIAPPNGRAASHGTLLTPMGSREGKAVACPRCASQDTECVSPFGSTPCKAQYRCRNCLEPFDHFKCI